MATEGFTDNLSVSAVSHEEVEFPAAFQNGAGTQLAQAETGSQDTAQTGQVTQSAPGIVNVAVGENNTVKLPGGASIERIEIDGDNLVLLQPDGTRIVIENAALNVPTFLIDDIEIPQEALVAALQANNINVAAGPDGSLSASSATSASSGGNFDSSIPGIGDAGPAIDLLAPTALQFPTLDQEIVGPARTNRGPSIALALDGGNEGEGESNGAGGIVVADKSVREAGLSAGTNSASNFEFATGAFTLSDPDTIADIVSLTINGQTFAIGELAGKTIDGQFGTLTITSYNVATGQATYTYELTKPVTTSPDNNNGANTEQNRDVFDLTVTDIGGLTGSATIRIDIVDDVPVIEIVAASEAQAQLAIELDETTGGKPSGSEEGPDDLRDFSPLFLKISAGNDRYNGNESEQGNNPNTDDDIGVLARVTTTVEGGLTALFNVTKQYGADLQGAEDIGTLSFTGFPVEGGIATNLSATVGGPITLFLTDANTITGKVEGGATVFTIKIVTIDGVQQIETTLLEAIRHNDENLFDNEAVLRLAGESGAIKLQYEVTVEDGDGDRATASASIDLISTRGSSFTFDDDGPTLTVDTNENAGSLLAVELDETKGSDRYNANEGEVGGNANNDDAANVLGRVTTKVAGGLTNLFTIGGDPGSDGEKSLAGTLSFTGFPVEGGITTNLSATNGGLITLFLTDSNTITGKVEGGATVFTIKIVTVDGVQQIETTLLEAIRHNDENRFDSEAVLKLAGEAGVIKLQYEVTRTDGDDDSVKESATVDLITSNGSAFTFDDDGPTLTVDAKEGARSLLAVELDETKGSDRYSTGETEDLGGNANNDDAANVLGRVTTKVAGGLTNLFTIGGDPGSDGEKSLTGTLSFTGIPQGGLVTTLSATNGGLITLFLTDANTITGKDTDGHSVLTIKIVTVGGVQQIETTLLEAIRHNDENRFDSEAVLKLAGEAGVIKLQYEVTRTDGDDDSVKESATVDLITSNGSAFTFDDDGPKLTKKDTITEIVDEDDIDTQLSEGTSPNDGDHDGSYTNNPNDGSAGPATVTGSLAGFVDFGSDQKGGYSISDRADSYFTGLGLSSKGADLQYAVNGSTLTATAVEGNNVRIVFTFTINAQTGAYEFRLFDQLDHDRPNDGSDQNYDLQDGVPGDVTWLDFGSAVSASDGDGDSIDLIGKLQIKIRDDVPELVSRGSEDVTVDEGDIHNNRSEGTSPNDGNHDGSLTGNNGSATVTGSLAHLVHSGADGDLAFSFIGENSLREKLSDLNLKSQGRELSYDLQGNVLYGFVNAQGIGQEYNVDQDRPVFKLTLNANGSYSFELIDQLDHDRPNPGSADHNKDLLDGRGVIDAIDFGSVIKATDFDGDSIGLRGVFTISVRDDVPEAHIALGSAQLVLDETVGTKAGDSNANDEAGVSNPFGSYGNVIGYAKAGEGSLFVNNSKGGADDSARTIYSLTLGKNVSGLYDTASGKQIMLKLDGGKVIGYVVDGGIQKVSFVATVNTASGEVQVFQYRAVKHDTTSNHDEQSASLASDALKLVVTVTDYDGDSDSKSVDIGSVIRFEDDGPVVTGVTPDQGAYGPNLVANGSFENGHGIGGGQWEIFKDIDNWQTGSNGIQFEVQASNAGGVPAQNGNALIELDGDFQGNGHPEGTPDASHSNATIQQAINGTVAGNVYELTFYYSPRGNAATAGMKVEFGGVEVFNSANGTYAQGTWHAITVRVTAPVHNAVLAFTGTGTEDEFGALLDNVSVKAVFSQTIDDENLTGGIPGGPGDDGFGLVSSGAINFNAGSDGLHSIAATLNTGNLKGIHVVGGVGTAYAVSTLWVAGKNALGNTAAGFEKGGTLVGTMDVNGTKVPAFTLEIRSDGMYTFTLQAPLSHPLHSGAGSTGSFEDNLALDFGFTIKDGDHDTATGTLTVNVDDDSPALAQGAKASVTVDEDDLDNLGGDSGDFYLFDIIEGSAGSSPQSPNTDTTDYQQTHGFLLGGMLNRIFNGSVVGNGTLSNVVNFGAYGAHSSGGFQLNASALSSLAGQGLKSQGDSVSYASINSEAGSVVFGYVSNINSGAVSTIFGALESLLNGQALSGIQLFQLAQALGNLPSGAEFRLVFALGTETNGTYQFRLFDQLDHAIGNVTGEGDQITIDFSALFRATDGDGDTISLGSGSFVIKVNDDGPTASVEAAQPISEGATISGHFDFAAGADGAALTHINGIAVGAFNVATGWSDYFNFGAGSLRVKADGSYEFKARAEDNYFQGTVKVDGTFTVTDHDGDSSTKSFEFNVADTINTTVVTLHDVTVYEDQKIVYTASVNNAPQTAFSVTLDNGVVVHFAAGSTTGSSAPQAAQGDEPWIDNEVRTVSIVGTSGGNYEAVDTSDKATVTINDRIQTNFVTLHDVAALENGQVVFSATRMYVSLTPFSIKLSNGVEIHFGPGALNGSSAPQLPYGEDPYQDGQQIPLSIQSYSGGNYEAVDISDTATVTVTDTIDTTTVTLTASLTITEAETFIVYTATLNNQAQAGHPVTVKLSNGATITINGGSTSNSINYPVTPSDDVYKDPTSVSVSITEAVGGNFENLVFNATPAVTQIVDTIDTVTATLTAGAAAPAVGGVNITYTITLSGAPGAIGAKDGPLVFKLTDGSEVTVLQNASSGQATIFYPYGNLPGASISNGIVSHTGGLEYEKLVSAGSTSVEVAQPLLVIGSSGDDVSASNLTHTLPNPTGSSQGVVQGGAFNDVLVGDPGAVPTVGKGDTANFVFVLDTSGSMSESIQFDGSSISRLEALQKAVTAAIDELAGSQAANVRIHIVQFNNAGGPGITFDLIKDGVRDQSQVDAAKAVVKGTDDTFSSSASTNYESALQQVKSWIGGNEVTYNVTGSESFDSNGNTSGGTAVLLNSYLTKIAIVSAWTSNGTVLGSVTNSDGDMGVNGDGNGLDNGQMLRFDFGRENTFNANNFDPSPSAGSTGYGTQFDTFQGPAIEFATFSIDGLNEWWLWNEGESLSYTVHYTDGLPTTSGPINVDESGNVTVGTNGRTIAFVEFLGTSDENSGVTVRLQSVKLDYDGPLSGANVKNKVIFVSDGEPNDGGSFADEVASIEPGFVIEAVGIKVGATALGILNTVEGNGGSATNITNANELIQVVGELAGGAVIPAQLGGDNINGDAGNDILFGDVMNTDKLADDKGLTAIKDGSGWQVFKQLEDTQQGGWNRNHSLTYIRAHMFELAKEMTVNNVAVRKGGDDAISGGLGNDVIFAQEGNDTISYSWNAGRDFVHGGTHKLDVSGVSVPDVDVVNLDITGAATAVFIETVAAYNQRINIPDYIPGSHPVFAGTDWQTSGIDWNSLILVSDASGQIHLELYEIEQINVTGTNANDVIVINGDFAGTQLSPNTIYVDMKEGNDTLDLRGLVPNRHVVADGGTGTGTDKVLVGFNVAGATYEATSSTALKVTQGTVTHELNNFEEITFADGSTKNLVLAVTSGTAKDGTSGGDLMVAGFGKSHQETTLSFASSYDPGDKVSITLDGVTYTHTVVANGKSAENVYDALMGIKSGGVSLSDSLKAKGVIWIPDNLTNNQVTLVAADGAAFTMTTAIVNSMALPWVYTITFDTPVQNFGSSSENITITIGTNPYTAFAPSNGNDNNRFDSAANSLVTKLVQANFDASYDNGTNTFTIKTTLPTDIKATSTSKDTAGAVVLKTEGYLPSDQAEPVVDTHNVGIGYTLNGGNGDDHLIGSGGNDFLIGGAGDDILSGGAGDDILAGGLGRNTLTGGGGNDIFVIDASAKAEGPALADIITDYQYAASGGDKVDLTELLNTVPSNGSLSNYVRTVEGGSGASDALQVSTTGKTADFVTVAYLDANAGVKILYNDDKEHTIQNPIV